MKLRRSFEEGHRRKLLIVVDESQEVESALYYAASRVQRSSGLIVMLYVASIDAKGPGPLVSSLASARVAGGFAVPVTVVPGQLSLAEIKALA